MPRSVAVQFVARTHIRSFYLPTTYVWLLAAGTYGRYIGRGVLVVVPLVGPVRRRRCQPQYLHLREQHTR